MQIDDVMALVDEYVSASIEDHGYRSGAASAEYLEDTKRKLLAAIESLIAAPQHAAPQQAEPPDWRNQIRVDFPSSDDISLAYQRGWNAALAAAPQQAEPVAQIGWADEFGNLFPMGAWKPTQRTHHDSHKTAWRPVFLHPPAAEVQLLRDAVAKLSTIVRVPNAEHIADEHNAAVAFLRRALEGGE